jgi:hypothetical protein
MHAIRERPKPSEPDSSVNKSRQSTSKRLNSSRKTFEHSRNCGLASSKGLKMVSKRYDAAYASGRRRLTRLDFHIT